MPYFYTSRFSHWSKLDGDGNLSWGPDALLTPTGEAQAVSARIAWKKELENGVPLPTKFIVSPHRRALDTFKITFLEAAEDENYLLYGYQGKAVIFEVRLRLSSTWVGNSRTGLLECS